MSYKDINLIHRKSIVNSRDECDTSAILGKHSFSIPVVASNMKSILNKEICKIFDDNNVFYIYHRIDGIEDVYQFCKYANSNLKITSISIGLTEEWLSFIKRIYNDGLNVDYFTVDVALSYTDKIIPILETIKELFRESFIIVGNGSSSEWLTWLSELKMVDCVKFNIGTSKVCRTKEWTGFSNDPMKTIIELKNTNNILDNKLVLMTDGGLTTDEKGIHYGDIAKALVLGADWIMSGAIYSQCIDSPTVKDGYYGNASSKANKISRIEGESMSVSTNGKTIKEQLNFIKECLQSSISYGGGSDLTCLKKHVKFTYLD